MFDSDQPNSLISRINRCYDQMTKAEKKVADFVLASPEKALNATITELAKQCGIGETSVFRFCKTLNFNGYQDFRLYLALSQNNPSTEPYTNSKSGEPSKKQELSYKVYNEYFDAIKKTYSNLDYSAINDTVQLISSANHVFLFGAGQSGLSALQMHAKFLRIMSNMSFDMDLNQQLMKASLLNSDSLAIVFSNSGITKDPITIARLAHQRGAKVIFITLLKNTPAAPYCDVILQCGAIEGPLEGNSISAKVSQEFIIDILYKEVQQRFGKVADKNKRITAEIITTKML